MKRKYFRKRLFLISVTLLISTLINLFAGIIVIGAAEGDGLEGSGTQDDPYQIWTDTELLNLQGQELSKHYKLMDDIDLSENGTLAEWTPITTFSGTFDGNGYTVSGFTIANTATVNIGFIGTLHGTVKNLTVANAKIYTSAASYQVGTIAGYSGGTDAIGVITGCVLEDSVTISTYAVEAGERVVHNGKLIIGGFVGYCHNNTDISYCESNANITVEEHYNATSDTRNGSIGGIVGYLPAGNVSYCVNNGSVTVKSYQDKKVNGWLGCGGIVGTTSPWSSVTVAYNINVGNVENTASNGAGGIVGSITGGQTLNLNHNYNLGSVIGGTEIGQILGWQNKAFTSENNYGLTDNGNLCGSTVTSGGMEASNEADMKAQAAYRSIVAGVSGLSAQLAAYQTSLTTRSKSEDDDTEVYDLRMVAVLQGELENCTSVGFDVTASYTEQGQTKTLTTKQYMTTVYQSITAVSDADTVQYTAQDLGGDYIFVLVCKNLPVDAGTVTFTVKPLYTTKLGEVAEFEQEIAVSGIDEDHRVNVKSVSFSLFSDFHYYAKDDPNGDANVRAWYPTSVVDLKNILTRAANENVDFVMQTGDFCQGWKQADYLIDAYLQNEQGLPVYGIYGNHDLETWEGGNTMALVTPQLTNQNDSVVWGTDTGAISSNGSIGYYYFEVNGFRMICLDSNYYLNADGNLEHVLSGSCNVASNALTSYSLGDSQLAWLEGVLLDAAEKDVPCIVFSHESFFALPDVTEQGESVSQLFDRVNTVQPGTVIMAINGHRHSYSAKTQNNILYLQMNVSRNGYGGNGPTIGGVEYTHYADESLTYLHEERVHDSVTNTWDLTGEFETRPLSYLYRSTATWWFTDALNAIVTVYEDGRIEIEGMETTWMYDIEPPAELNCSNTPCVPDSVWDLDIP